jgi:hypothetical protein
MSLALNSLQPKLFRIQSLDGSKTIDLMGSSSVLFLDYYEDILSPSIMLTAQIMSSTSILNVLPIRGGEQVQLQVETAFGEFEFQGERSLYVYKVSGISQETNSETFTLNLISREGITNETVRCKRRYDGTIDQSVSKILKDVLLTDRFNSKNIEKSVNSYSFIGNQKKPFHILTWLGPKSIPIGTSPTNLSGGDLSAEAKGVAGFLFYENKEGFNFKSVEGLVKNTQPGTSNLKDIVRYYYTQVTEANTPIQEYRILNYNFEKNTDLLKNLRVGMYANATYFYNLYDNRLSLIKYILKNEIKDASTLGADANVAISQELGESISRLMVRTSDIGVMDNRSGTSGITDTTPMRDETDMAKSTSRYNLLFTQSLNMVVPCNVNLKVGDIIYAEFPRIRNSDNREADDQQSGNYLIKQLRHHMEPTMMLTSLKLIRDSYGLYSPSNLF